MWPSLKLPELTSEILNQLQTEAKESQIIMNVSTEGNNGSNNVETFLFGMKKLVSSLRKLLRISVLVIRFIKTKVFNISGTVYWSPFFKVYQIQDQFPRERFSCWVYYGYVLFNKIVLRRCLLH